MMANIDIENSQTKKVITLKVPVIEFKTHQYVKFDLAQLTKHEKILIEDALDVTMPHTEIEMFFIDNKNNEPKFGPDYEFELSDDELIGIYTRDKWLKERRVNNRK